MEFDISVIYVNYNVKHFLSQSINSVLSATQNLKVEIIIVDNQSTDGSQEFFEIHHPQASYIYNNENVGFGTANNQGVAIAKGKYVLLLNPDTILTNENTLIACFNYLEANSSVGMIGVRMVNGTGDFLPESKRSIPTPFSSFCKLSGLHKILPSSKSVASYYLGHLAPDQIHEIEVLTGAFMFLPLSIYDKVGGFDQDYFMYGEDIDLSYKVSKSGLKIHYLGDLHILHYKGQSTNKFSWKYIKNFYEAMAIFYKKHKSTNSVLLHIFIYLAIILGAIVGALKSIFITLFLPLLDWSIFLFTSLSIAKLWGGLYFENWHYYDNSPLIFNSLIGTGIWVLSIYLFKGYRGLDSIKKYSLGLTVGIFLTLLIYGFLSLEFRTSRVVAILAAAVSLIFGIGWRKLFLAFKHQKMSKDLDRVLIISSQKTVSEIMDSYNRHQNESKKGYVRNLNYPAKEIAINSSYQTFVSNIINLEKINKLVFSTADFTNEEIKGFINKMPKTKDVGLYDSGKIFWSSSLNTKSNFSF